MRKLKPHGTLILEAGGERVVDEELAKLLLLIEKTGSILSASKTLRMSYSRAWESIARAEKILRAKLVEPKRGGRKGGGAKLTKAGKRILSRYLEEYRRLFNKRLSIPGAELEAPEIVYAGSNDLLLEHIFGLMRAEGVEHIEVAWVGSSGGLTLLMLGEADLAGVHLYDPESGEYNLPYIRRYWLDGRVVLVRGYEREIGFASRIEVNDPIELLIKGEIRLVNRNLGSGTRVLFDYVLKKKAEEVGKKFDELVRAVKGYDKEVKTHLKVVETIVAGRADIGLTTRWAAERYGLRFKPLKWENFDFAISKCSISREPIKKFLKALTSEKTKGLVEKIPGYRIPSDIGKVIYGESLSDI
ncbi:MAG: LysR family transcriptional regulator [Thaumarchaeota archaeon]|nr:LysR family transcriptional regulator [Nitrososphaerota archaeon]